MNKSETITELAKALSSAQAEMPAVPLTAFNPFFKSRYADLGSVIDTARPILAKNGLSVSQLAVSDPGEVGVETLLMHTSGEWISGRVTIPATAKAQEAGATITYLRRYAYSAILGMYADEDNDGNDPNKKAGEKKEAAKSPKGNGQITPAKIVELKLADNPVNAAKLIDMLAVAGWEEQAALNKISIYRVWRVKAKLEPTAAAEKTNAGEVYVEAK
jgi:hypothetical protein